MKILFDNSTPAPLRRVLRGHEVQLSGKLGWQRLENGVLLNAAENAGFDILITCDQNLRYQQNFTDRKIAVIILSTNFWPEVEMVAARIATAVDFVQRGQVLRVEIPSFSS